jgi:hypothetical protein
LHEPIRQNRTRQTLPDEQIIVCQKYENLFS